MAKGFFILRPFFIDRTAGFIHRKTEFDAPDRGGCGESGIANTNAAESLQTGFELY
jgi:hypothetical protein